MAADVLSHGLSGQQIWLLSAHFLAVCTGHCVPNARHRRGTPALPYSRYLLTDRIRDVTKHFARTGVKLRHWWRQERTSDDILKGNENWRVCASVNGHPVYLPALRTGL
jgi:hypothetical protein